MSKAKPTVKAEELDLSPVAGEAVEGGQAPEDASLQVEGVAAPEVASSAAEEQNPAPAVETPPEDSPEAVTARVLCAGRIGDRSFAAGVVVEGVPVEVAQAHASMLDANPEAVSHAVESGAPVFPYAEV